MNVVDSSGWLEYFADGPNADFFAPAILDGKALLVPSVCLVEVFRRIRSQRDEAAALQGVALMQQARIVDLDAGLAVFAGRLGIEHRIPLADSIVLATARAHDADVWTQDADFDGLSRVRYRPKKR